MNDNIELYLGEIETKIKHIDESFDKFKRDEVVDIYATLDEILKKVTSKVTISNPTSSQNTAGGRNTTEGILHNINNEIKNFHVDVIRLLKIENSTNNGQSGPELVKAFKDALRAKDIADKEYKEEKVNNLSSNRIHELFLEKRQREEEKNFKATYGNLVNKYERGKKWDKFKDDNFGSTGKIINTLLSPVFNATSKVAKGIKPDDIVNGLTSKLSSLGPYGALASAGIQSMKALFDLYAKTDKEAGKYAREVGGGRAGRIEANVRSQEIARQAKVQYGIEQGEAIQYMTKLAEQIGRSTATMSVQSLTSGIMLEKMGIGADAVNNFDTFGKSLSQTDRYFTNLYKEVSKKGLSFKNVSKSVNDNLKAAQLHTFSNGIRGLERMAEKSVQLKTNMQQVFTFADKVSTLEGAVKVGAELSALGGSFAQYANPMQLLYEGLNDMEALQNRMIKSFGNAAYFDEQKGEMTISPYQQQMIKQAAQSMGIDANEAATMALNEGKFRMIESQINKTNIDTSTKDGQNVLEYIKNIAELNEKGHAFVTLNGKETLVSELSIANAEALKEASREKSEKDAANMGDIFIETKGVGEKLDDIFKYLTTRLGTMVAKIAGVERSNSGRQYWRYLKDNRGSEEYKDLLEKYGSDKMIRQALLRGQATDSELEFYGNQDRLDYVENHNGFLGFGRERYYRGSSKDKFRKYLDKHLNANSSNISSNSIEDSSDYFDGNTYSRGGIVNGNSNVGDKVIARVNSGEMILNKEQQASLFYSIKNASNNIPIKNIDENIYKPMRVQPTNNYMAQNQVQKISFDNFKVEIGGKVELASNGNKVKDFSVKDLSNEQLNQLTDLLYDKIYKAIKFKIEGGYNKEFSHLRYT